MDASRATATLSLTLAALAFAAAASPSRAEARSALILPRVGGSGVGAEARDEALAHLRTVITNDGWVLFDTDGVSLQLDASLASCGADDECAAELRARLEVDAAVGLRVFGTEERVERVSVFLVGARGVGTGAVVVVDDELPLPFAVAEAFRTAAAQLTVGRVHDALPPPATPVAAPAEAQVAPSPLNWFLGGLLALGSAPMLGYGINSAVRDGECIAEGSGGSCTERIRFREGAGLFTGLGAVMLAAGIFVLVAQPIRFGVYADSESASLHVSGRF